MPWHWSAETFRPPGGPIRSLGEMDGILISGEVRIGKRTRPSFASPARFGWSRGYCYIDAHQPNVALRPPSA